MLITIKTIRTTRGNIADIIGSHSGEIIRHIRLTGGLPRSA